MGWLAKDERSLRVSTVTIGSAYLIPLSFSVNRLHVAVYCLLNTIPAAGPCELWLRGYSLSVSGFEQNSIIAGVDRSVSLAAVCEVLHRFTLFTLVGGAAVIDLRLLDLTCTKSAFGLHLGRSA